LWGEVRRVWRVVWRVEVRVEVRVVKVEREADKKVRESAVRGDDVGAAVVG